MDDKNNAVFKPAFKPVSIYIFILLTLTLHSRTSHWPKKKKKKTGARKSNIPSKVYRVYTGQNHHELIFIHHANRS